VLEEKFMLAKPTPTDRLDEYLDKEGRILSWTASFPLPPIGARVFITVNQIGWAEVRGYFRSGERRGDGTIRLSHLFRVRLRNNVNDCVFKV